LGESAPITPHVHTRMLRGCPQCRQSQSVLVVDFVQKSHAIVGSLLLPSEARGIVFFSYFDDATKRAYLGDLRCPRERDTRVRARENPNAQSRVSVWDRSDPRLFGTVQSERKQLFGSGPFHLHHHHTTNTTNTTNFTFGCVSLYSGTRLFAPSPRSSVFIFIYMISYEA
jgi:hypothetical protein